MKKLIYRILTSLIAGLLLFSCATDIGAVRPVLPTAAVTVDPEAIVVPEIPSAPEDIMGIGEVYAPVLADFLLRHNPGADRGFVYALAEFYVSEAAIEGVNHDVAFTQMCLETGFLRFGGDVKPEQYNFCGLGAVGNGAPGLEFPEPVIGVRAHIQHLKAYASEEPLQQELINPRFRFVRRGSAPKIDGLTGTWAADPLYAEKIHAMLDRLYRFYAEIMYNAEGGK